MSAWATNYEIWTSLVWQLEVLLIYRDSSRILDADRIHVREIYSTVIDLPDDAISARRRMGDLRDWMDQLADLNYPIDIGPNQFIASYQPTARLRPYHLAPRQSQSQPS